MTLSLRKSGRIQRTVDFQRLYRQGHRVSNPLLTVYYLPNGLDVTRFGITVGKKMGKAVQRNTLKRILREIVRGWETEAMPGHDVVMHVRPGCRGASYQEIQMAFVQLMAQTGVFAGHGGKGVQ